MTKNQMQTVINNRESKVKELESQLSAVNSDLIYILKNNKNLLLPLTLRINDERI